MLVSAFFDFTCFLELGIARSGSSYISYLSGVYWWFKGVLKQFRRLSESDRRNNGSRNSVFVTYIYFAWAYIDLQKLITHTRDPRLRNGTEIVAKTARETGKKNNRLALFRKINENFFSCWFRSFFFTYNIMRKKFLISLRNQFKSESGCLPIKTQFYARGGCSILYIYINRYFFWTRCHRKYSPSKTAVMSAYLR